MKKQLLNYALLFFVALIGYGGSLRYGFSQDDYYHLIISRIGSLADFVQVFVPSSDWIFYRPLSTQLYYFVFFSLFGLSAPPYMHLFMLFLHAGNGLLVAHMLKRYLGKSHSTLALLGGVLYTLSGVHFLSLFYIGATQQLMATSFSLLALSFNPLWLIGALLSKEITIRVIPLFFIITYVRTRSLKKSLHSLFVPTVILLLYFLVRLVFGFGGAGEYALSFSPSTTLATVMWYLLFSLGFPEYLLDFGLSGGMIDWSSYISSLGTLTLLNFAFSTLTLLGLVIIIVKQVLRRNWITLMTLGSIWLIGLLPIILLPTHRYAHYLDLSLFAFLYLLLSEKSRLLKFVIFFTLIIASITSIKIDQLTHWTTSRANLAKHLTTRIQSEGACQYQIWYLDTDQETKKQVEYALMYDNGPNIICGKDSIKFVNDPHLAEYKFVINSSELE